MSKIRRRIWLTITRWRNASLLKRRQFLSAAAKTLYIDYRLKRDGFIAVRDSLSFRAPPKSLIIDTEPRELARIVNTAARFTIGRQKSCLRRSLLLWWLLDKRGIECDLRMGMRSDDGSLVGHAWVEIDGVPINDRKGIRDTYDVLDFGGQLTPSAFISKSL